MSRRAGFTLAEMTVVIGTIAVLAAILFPAFARARERARTCSCEANLFNTALALRIYASDYDGRLPLGPAGPEVLADLGLIDGWTLLCPTAINQVWVADLTYIRLREAVLAGRDTAADAAEGLTLCRGALDAQAEYIRLRPGFAVDYPLEVNTDTLRCLAVEWRRLITEPERCRDLDICAFLDRVEAEAAGGEEA